MLDSRQLMTEKAKIICPHPVGNMSMPSIVDIKIKNVVTLNLFLELPDLCDKIAVKILFGSYICVQV